MTSAVLALLLAAAPAGRALSVDPGASVVRFHLHHKLHEVNGRSSSIEGKAVVGDDGKVLAMVRIPVATFDTGDANRDSHMRETLQASKFPHVVFKGVSSLTVPAVHGKPIDTKLQGELEFHGVRRPVEIPVSVAFAADGGATVRGKLAVSLEAHGIDRPALLFVKVDDELQVEVELTLTGPR